MNPMVFSTCALLLLGAFSVSAHAQSVTFAGVQTMVPASGLSYPAGVAVDGAGDIFIADYFNSRVVEVPAAGGAQSTLGSGLSTPFSVAVDGAGDVFIADYGNSRVVEIPYLGNGTYGAQTTVSGVNYPTGVAVDGAGNVFMADFNDSLVYEVPAGGGALTSVGSGLLNPTGVGVDGAGDVFISDARGVVKVPYLGNGTYGLQTTVGSGLSFTKSVAVDGSGDVFIADSNNNRVVEVPAGGGTQTTVGSGLLDPYGVAVDGAGDVFIADTRNNRVVEIQRVAVNFGNVNVCPAGQTSPAPCNQTLTLNYNVGTTTNFGTIKVVTQGAPSLDFTLGSGSTCTGTISAGGTCALNVTFAPLAPGVRMGAVQLTDNSGNVLVTTMIHGIGQGPAITFGPGVQTTVPGSGLANPYGIALDGAGDVFIADPSNTRVVKVPAGGGPQTTVGSGLINPVGLAVDGAGNVFIADTALNSVVEVPAGGGPQTTVGSGLTNPAGVAVDGAGNVFIADSGNNRAVEVPAGGGNQFTLGSGLFDPVGIAVDGAGNVFIADTRNNRVVKVPAGGGPQTTLVNGLYNPTGISVDGAGDVFVADFDNDRILELPAGGGPPTMVYGSWFYPFDVKVDGAGNLFVMDWENSRVVELHRSQPPTFNFGSTVVAFTSSPQSVTVQNIGNQPLNAITPGLVVGGPNFLQVAGSGTPADCTSSFLLAPGATCNLSISFEPQTVGNLTAAATFTENALNTIPSASQNIALQGTGYQLGQTITFTQPAPASASYYSAFTVAAQSSSGLTVALSVDAASASICSLGTPNVASGVTSATVAMMSPTGICTIDANQSGSASYQAAAQQQTSATAAVIGTSLTVTNTNDSGFGSLRDAMANAVSGDTINFSLASPATITLASTLTVNTSLTISGPGASNVAISGGNAVQVFSIGGGTTVNISGVTIENGNNSNGNSYYGSASGGGIANAGTLTLDNCAVSGNSANVSNFGFNANAYGGGIYNTGTLTISNSTISGNSANVGGFAYYADGYGGGIANTGTLTLLNSTISGNSASVGSFSLQISIFGGGIANTGTLTLSNTTISGNSASVGSWESGSVIVFGGGISNGMSGYGGANTNVGTLTAKNTIVANNPSGGNCGGNIISEGYNLSDDASCAAFFTQPGDLNSTAAGLDPSGLKANGGPTQTIAPLTGSPAVDAIPMSPINYCTDTSGNPVTTDQTGATRPQGSGCDIGAVEVAGTQAAGQTSQTLSFTRGAPGTASYNSTFPVGAQSSSGLTVTLSVDSPSSSVCALGTPGVAGGVTSATVTMTSGTGTCTIFAIQSGNATYSAALLQHTSATAQQIGQTIAFTQSAPAQAVYSSTFTVAANASSSQPVSFSSSGACSNVGATFTMISGTGTCSVIASQAGNNSYTAAPTVTQTVIATLASQTIAFTQSAPAQAPYNSSFTVAASASSGQPVSFSSSGVCSNMGATFTMTNGVGTCTVIANQSGNANYQAAPAVTETTVADKPAQTVTFTGAPATAPYQSTFTVTATTNSGITPAITAAGSCSISGTTVSMTSGTGPCTMTAKWAGNTDYLATTVTQTTTAEKLVSPVTWTAPAAIAYGTALSGTQLDATANIAGSFVYSPAAGTVPKGGSDTLKVTFTPTLSKDYTAVTASVVLQVTQATPTITWTSPAAIAYGTALSGTQLDATASVAGKFVYSPAAGKVLTAGTQNLSVTFTPTDHVDYSSVTDTVTLVINKVGTTTTITSNIPNPSTHGNAVLVHFTVTAATDYKAPTGKVTVNASTGESCTGTLVNGSGSCSVTLNTVGASTLTATYAGDSNNNSSVSGGVAQTVN
jgi:large repetitive protein